MENCRAMIEKFERKAKQTAKSITLTSTVKRQRRDEDIENQARSNNQSLSISKSESKVKVDFRAVDSQTLNPALKADKVLGLVIDPDTDNKYFVIRWKNSKDRQVDLVSALHANKHYPTEVIAFYESKIVFS